LHIVQYNSLSLKKCVYNKNSYSQLSKWNDHWDCVAITSNNLQIHDVHASILPVIVTRGSNVATVAISPFCVICILHEADLAIVFIFAPPLKKSKSRWVILRLHRQHLKRSQEGKDTVEVYHTAGFFDAASFL